VSHAEAAIPPHDDVRPPLLRWGPAGCLILAAFILIIFRLHAFALPLETDECNYAYTAGRLLEGDRLYVDVWDHQPPGVFVLFGAAIAMFGDEPVVFRSLAMVFSLASMLLLAGIGRVLRGRWCGAAAALLFALTSADPGTAGEGCNREIFMNTFVLAAWYAAARADWPAGRRALLAGLALGLGSVIKTVLVVHWVALAPVLLLAVPAGGSRGRTALRTLVLFAGGPAAVWLLTGTYFAVTSRWHAFVDAVFLFNVGYAGGEGSLLGRFAAFFSPEGHPFTFDSAIALWIAGAAAAVWLVVRIVTRRDVAAALGLALALASFVAACLPAHFWPHYYYLLIPALVLALAIAFGDGLGPDRRRLWPLSGRSKASLGALVVLLGFVAYGQYRDYLSQPPFGITVKRYNSRDFWGRAMGEKVRAVTDPDDTIFVSGSDTGVYYYAQRRCASRYTMITGLAEGYPGVVQRRQVLLDELTANPPRLVLLLFDQPPFPGWKEFLDEHYGQPVGMDFHDRREEVIMFVLTRKDRPIAAQDPAYWNWHRREVGGW
jgi:hypothetical protein